MARLRQAFFLWHLGICEVSVDYTRPFAELNVSGIACSIDLSGTFKADLSICLVSDAVTVHVHDFGAYHACGPESTSSNREIYLKLFDSIFEPYLKSVTFEEEIDRRLDLLNVLDAAAEHGMRVIGCPNYDFRYKWGERDVDNILSYPALWASIYDGGQLVREAELIKARDDPVVRGTEV